MKRYILPRFFVLFFVFSLVSFSDPYSIKRVTDKDFRYEFYIIEKKITPKKDRVYAWFKGGLIHEAQGGIGGDLLNDKFTKMYHNNQLAEQGKFKKGLRVGEWKTWHQNGVLASIQTWNNGFRSGKFLRYNFNGTLVESGNYMSNVKTGKWINIEDNDTIRYKKGLAVIEKQQYSNSEKYRIKQENSNLKKTKKTQRELEQTIDAEKLATLKAKTKELKEARKEKNEAEKRAKAEAKKAAKEAKEQLKSEPKKESKISAFFNNLFKKKDNGKR